MSVCELPNALSAAGTVVVADTPPAATLNRLTVCALWLALNLLMPAGVFTLSASLTVAQHRPL
jgi:hypothetical protein